MHRGWDEVAKDTLLNHILDNRDAAYIPDLWQGMISQEYTDMTLGIEDAKFFVEEQNYVCRYPTRTNAVFSAVAGVRETLRSWI